MTTRFLTVPGLASSGPNHWQTIWEVQYPHLFSRAEQVNWDWPVKDEWVVKLQEQISKLTEPTVLVAHSLGCITVAHWAQEYTSEFISGALLVAPADAELSKRLNFVVGFTPVPTLKLPFKSIVVASNNDIYATIGRSEIFARNWGSEFINIGRKGHINAVSKLHDWQEGKLILEQLSSFELSKETVQELS
ncbi:RBBP9/YdeN family alpha/beta hydrolase [Dyadobacter psychrotolerans]|uniref:Alpha/beta hydrolase n=1 Tax=Dyadobacter psychrotolerans TaxID=2541721 RepID=A0A4R5DLE7_9BACT|nr:alpha/beta hydrolase [Dyadobacter psychrotolerans]TDE12854.1 alpha/beta hydrolase [Dyadobacter psychrotolerans]